MALSLIRLLVCRNRVSRQPVRLNPNLGAIIALSLEAGSAARRSAEGRQRGREREGEKEGETMSGAEGGDAKRVKFSVPEGEPAGAKVRPTEARLSLCRNRTDTRNRNADAVRKKEWTPDPRATRREKKQSD